MAILLEKERSFFLSWAYVSQRSFAKMDVSKVDGAPCSSSLHILQWVGEYGPAILRSTMLTAFERKEVYFIRVNTVHREELQYDMLDYCFLEAAQWENDGTWMRVPPYDSNKSRAHEYKSSLSQWILGVERPSCDRGCSLGLRAFRTRRTSAMQNHSLCKQMDCGCYYIFGSPFTSCHCLLYKPLISANFDDNVWKSYISSNFEYFLVCLDGDFFWRICSIRPPRP